MSKVLETAIALLRMTTATVFDERLEWRQNLSISRKLLEEHIDELWRQQADASKLKISFYELNVLLAAASNSLLEDVALEAPSEPARVALAIADLFDPNMHAPILVSAERLEPSNLAHEAIFQVDPRLIFFYCNSVKGRAIREILPRGHCITSSDEQLKHWRRLQSRLDSWLTIVIPTMGESSLEESVISLLRQTETHFSVVIISGETNGKARSVLNRLEIDERFLLIESTDNGPYDAMNLGNLISLTEWIYVLGSGDKLASERVLEKIHKVVAERSGSDIVYGNVMMRGEAEGSHDGQIYDWAFDYDRLLNSNPCHQAIFYRREKVMAHGGYNAEYEICADWDLNIRMWQKARPVFTDLTVAEFQRGGMSTTIRDHKFFADLPKVWELNA